jgi:hypothetical protein
MQQILHNSKFASLLEICSFLFYILKNSEYNKFYYMMR